MKTSEDDDRLYLSGYANSNMATVFTRSASRRYEYECVGYKRMDFYPPDYVQFREMNVIYGNFLRPTFVFKT